MVALDSGQELFQLRVPKTHGFSYIPKQWRVLPDFGLDIDNNQSISIAKKVIYMYSFVAVRVDHRFGLLFTPL